MRSVIIIAAGVAIWLACFAVVRWRGDPRHVILPRATIGFVLAWAAVVVVNLWMVVTRAGDDLVGALPVQLLVFLLPSTMAVLTSWRERGRVKRIGRNPAG